MIRKLDRVVLRVPNLSSAVKYYRDALGLRVTREETKVASLRFADDAHVELILHSDPDLPAEAIYYLVDDVRAMYRQRDELKLTFHSPPVRVARGYRATVKDPFGLVLNLLDRAAQKPASDANGTTGPAGVEQEHLEDAKAVGSLFAGIEHHVPAKRELLARLYEKLGRTTDDLPYTPHFESLYEPYVAKYHDPKPSRAEVWRHLLNLRKSGKLPKLGEARSNPPDVSDEARERLRNVLGDDIGKRDRLPYSGRFDQIVDEFNATLPRGERLSPHHVWRLVATIAK